MGNLIRASVLALPLLICCSRNPQQSQGAGPATSALAAAVSAKPPDAAQPTPEAAVKAWNDALNRHDLDALRTAYAPDVLFYGRHMTGADVVAAKAQAFAKEPDFRQEVSDFASSETSDSITVRFTKAWTTKGTTRRVGGSVGLKRTDGRFLVTAETDVATADSQAKTWTCGKCRNSDKSGPDQLTPGGVKPEYFAWTVDVTQGGSTRKAELSDVLQPVALGGLAGWSCTVGAAEGHLGKGPMEESSTFYIEGRQLYCSQLDGGTAKLISDVECSPRGSDTDSDFIELKPGNKVQLTCAMLPSQ